MSRSRNRAKLNKAQDSKEYLAIQYDIEYPLYWDEGCSMYPRWKNSGSKNSNKQIFYYQKRMYRTWKHNRKTQWKE